MKFSIYALAALMMSSQSAFAAQQKEEVIECPLYAELPFPLSNRSGRIVSHYVKDGDELRAVSLFDVPETYMIEEHVTYQGSKLREFYQYSRYSNPNHKWIRMNINRNSGAPVADVSVIRGDDEGDFKQAPYDKQRPFFLKHSKAPIFDAVRSQPMSAGWIPDFASASPTPRNGDMRPNPFTEDLETPIHAIFYSLRLLKPSEVKFGPNARKLFVVGKRQQIYPVTFTATATKTPGVVLWKTALILKESTQPMTIEIDHNTQTIKSFKVEVSMSLVSATLKSTGPCVLR